ncbi:hypothetical protein D3C73_1045860 [compost metagenome]
MVQVPVVIDAALVLEILDRFGTQAFGHHLQAFIGLAPAGGAAPIKHRNAHEFAHRRQADDTDFAALAAGEKSVIFVQFAGLYFGGQFPAGGSLRRRDAAKG